MKKKLHKLLVFFVLCQLNAVAQTGGFNYEAAIQPVDSSGFYNIVLTPELNARLKIDYSDVRIVNDSGKWVPHLVRNLRSGYVHGSTIFDLKIIRKENNNTLTELVVPGRGSINSNLTLFIANTAAVRFCSVSGSNDLNSWFTINDSILVNPVSDPAKSETIFDINFPPCNYQFFRVLIDNRDKAPFNITHVGTRGLVSPAAKSGQYSMVENPPCAVSQKDSAKITVIKIQQSAAYHFEVFSVKISGVKYFKRDAYLYIPGSADLNSSAQSKIRFTFSNNSNLQFSLRPCNPQTFYIYIHNDDNLPLKIDEVKTFSSYSVATAYLDKGTHYKLLMDNLSVTAPDYDLYPNDIPGDVNIPTASISELISLQQPAVTEQKSNPKALIWIAIGIAVIVLGFFTYRLITDMNKSKT